VSTVVVGIKALVASGEKFAQLARKGADLVRGAESNSAALARFEETSAAATRETLKECHAALRALVAHALDREPSDAEVDAVFAAVAEHPNAPFRFHRLLGEARKSASRRRRRFLASVFFGLPFSKLPDDDRDRVDMAVERMTVADVEFLAMVQAKRRTPEEHKVDGKSYIFGDDGIGAVIRGSELRIATPNEWTLDGFVPGFFEDPRFIGDRAALASLVSVGCLDLGEAVTHLGNKEKANPLRILPLGHMVIRAIEEVGPGFIPSNE